MVGSCDVPSAVVGDLSKRVTPGEFQIGHMQPTTEQARAIELGLNTFNAQDRLSGCSRGTTVTFSASHAPGASRARYVRQSRGSR